MSGGSGRPDGGAGVDAGDGSAGPGDRDAPAGAGADAGTGTAGSRPPQDLAPSVPVRVDRSSGDPGPGIVVADEWAALRAWTPARIALGRTGASQPTSAQLAFTLAHAKARDAVHAPLDALALQRALEQAGFEVLQAHSRAADRRTYLRRPDLGRRLDEASLARLTAAAPAHPPDLLFVIADGLSATAVARHALPVLLAAREQLPGWRIGPLVVAQQARVALGDEAGQALRAGAVALLVGERPGLSSPDSLGLYLTWAPRVGRSDAERNCISNIRPEGLPYRQAARTLAALLDGARRLGRTGVDLKEDGGAGLAFEARPEPIPGET